MQHTTISLAARLAAAALLAAGAAGSSHAQEPASATPNEVRIGAYFVHHDVSADDVSGPFTPAGINLRVGNVVTPYLAYVRELDAHWALEVAGGIPPKTKTYGKGPAVVGSVPFDGQEVATAKWLSPSVLIEYKFLDPTKAIRPFVGIGFNYTHFYELDSTPAGNAVNGGPTSVKLTNSFGPAGTVGASWKVAERFSVNASFSLAKIDSHYTSDTSGVIRETHIHFNPRAFILSGGYSF